MGEEREGEGAGEEMEGERVGEGRRGEWARVCEGRVGKGMGEVSEGSVGEGRRG